MIIEACAAGVSLEEFWDYTPHEFNLVMQGYAKRTRRSYELMAWHACHSINMWRKKGSRPIKPKDLLRSGKELTPENFGGGRKLFEYLANKQRAQKEERQGV